MGNKVSARRPDAVKQVISALLADDGRETCDDLINKADVTYRDFGFGLRFHRLNDEALTAFQRAQGETPWMFQISFEVAVQELRCKQHQAAKRSALRAWNQIKKYSERREADDYLTRRKSGIAKLLGDICSALGDDDAAADWWRESVELAIDKADAVVEVGRRLISRGKSDAAREVLSCQPNLVEQDTRISTELKEIEKPQAKEEGCSSRSEDSPRRIAILVDVANIECARRDGVFTGSLEYERVRELIAGGAEIVAQDAFVPDLTEIMSDVGDHLKGLGFTVRPVRSRWQGGRVKADADAAIGAWMMLHIATSRPDEVWIVTSDEDFAALVEPAHEMQPGVKVCFAGVNQNGHSELARRGDRWLVLSSDAGEVPVAA